MERNEVTGDAAARPANPAPDSGREVSRVGERCQTDNPLPFVDIEKVYVVAQLFVGLSLTAESDYIITLVKLGSCVDGGCEA